MLKRVFFPNDPSPSLFGVLMLFFRTIIGLMFLNHGIQKWMMYSEVSSVFPDPLHIGSAWSLILVVMAEVVCSVFFIFGFLYRLVLLPMIFAMGMAFFVIHDGSLDNGGELSFIYLLIFVWMYLLGPGGYSIDAWLDNKWLSERSR